MMTRSTGVCRPGILSKIKYDHTTFMIGKIEQQRRTTKIQDLSHLRTLAHENSSIIVTRDTRFYLKERKQKTVRLKHGDIDD